MRNISSLLVYASVAGQARTKVHVLTGSDATGNCVSFNAVPLLLVDKTESEYPSRQRQGNILAAYPWRVPLQGHCICASYQRMCIDYHALNKLSVKHHVYLLCIDECLDKLLQGASYFTYVDLKSGYYFQSYL